MAQIIKKLHEGYNLTYRDNTYYVEMTDLHELGVDTSLSNNPCKSHISVYVHSLHKYIDYPVVSMFTRLKDGPTGYEYLDGNPVLYALKNEKSYKFKSIKDLKFIEQRFIEIFNKHFEIVGNNITVISPSYNKVKLPESGIVVPTTSTINQMITRLIHTVVPHITFVDQAIRKMTTDEIYALCTSVDNHFYKFYANRLKYSDTELDSVFTELDSYLNYMDENRNGFYCKHDVKNQVMRQHIVNTLQINSDHTKYNKDINNKDILLIDDTLTYGQTIQQCINILLDNYKPKSITILTMFSAKQNY